MLIEGSISCLGDKICKFIDKVLIFLNLLMLQAVKIVYNSGGPKRKTP